MMMVNIISLLCIFIAPIWRRKKFLALGIKWPGAGFSQTENQYKSRSPSKKFLILISYISFRKIYIYFYLYMFFLLEKFSLFFTLYSFGKNTYFLSHIRFLIFPRKIKNPLLMVLFHQATDIKKTPTLFVGAFVLFAFTATFFTLIVYHSFRSPRFTFSITYEYSF